MELVEASTLSALSGRKEMKIGRDQTLNQPNKVELVELASRTCFGGVVLPPTEPAVVDPVELTDVAIHPLASRTSNWPVELDLQEL